MSSEDRRRELRAKADALRAAQAERMERLRREDVVSRFERWHAGDLAAFAMPHRLAWPWEGVAHGPFPRYAFAFSGIDWALVPDAVTAYGGTPSGLKALLEEAFEALDVAPARAVQVVWSSGDLPALFAHAADVLRHAEALIGWGMDMWVFDPDADWIVECYHEGTLGYAPRPGRPEHAGFHWDPRRRRAERRAQRDAARANATTGDAGGEPGR